MLFYSFEYFSVYNIIMKIKNNKTKKKIIHLNKKLSKRQTGGEKLGEGSFGCVVTPPISCGKKNYSNKYVSKLITVNDSDDLNDIKNELNMNNLVNSVDKQNKYFTTIIDGCVLKNVDKKRKDIKFVNKKNVSKKDVCLVLKKRKNMNLIMKHAGLNLDDVLLYDKYKSERKILKNNYLRLFHNTLIGLKKIHNINLTHHDIKTDNFALKVSDKDNISLTYLDFGLMEDNLELKKLGVSSFSRSVYGTPGFMAPDMYVLAKIIKYLDIYSVTDLQKEKMKDRICNSIIKEINKYETGFQVSINMNLISLNFPISEIKSAKLSFNSYNLFNIKHIQFLYDFFLKNIIEKKIINLCYDKHGINHKYDIYALGISFFKIIQALNINNKKIINLIKNMVEIHPMHRYNVNQCINHPCFDNLGMNSKSKKQSTKKKSKK